MAATAEDAARRGPWFGSWTGRDVRVRGAVVALVIGLAVAPVFLGEYHKFIVSLVGVYAILAVGLNLLIGWSGQLGLAHAGFFGLGAYVSNDLFARGVPFPLAGLITVVGVTVLAVLLGLPAARLRMFYLAIATLAFLELMGRLFIEAEGFTGGVNGIGVEMVDVPGLSHTTFIYYLIMAGALITYGVLTRLFYGRLGRMVTSVRESDIVASSLGISPKKYRLVAFGASGALAGFAGVLYAQLITFVSPDQFGINFMIKLIVISFVGGVATLAGGVIGAIYLVVATELLQRFQEYQLVAFAVSLMLVIGFLPGGLASLPERVLGLFRRGPGAAGPARRVDGKETAAAPPEPVSDGAFTGAAHEREEHVPQVGQG